MVDPTRNAQAPMFEILIRWSPTGQMQVVLPQLDPTVILGMLEMAKVMLNDKRQDRAKEQLVVPARMS